MNPYKIAYTAVELVERRRSHACWLSAINSQLWIFFQVPVIAPLTSSPNIFLRTQAITMALYGGI